MSIIRYTHDGKRKEMKVVFDGKSEAADLLLALSRLDAQPEETQDEETQA